MEGPGLKGAGGPPARIAPFVENLSAQRITSKCTCECTQVRGPTSGMERGLRPGSGVRGAGESYEKHLLIKIRRVGGAVFFSLPKACTWREMRVGADSDLWHYRTPPLQASAPTSVHTATTRAPSPARSSITCSATTGSRRVEPAPGHPQSHRPLPSGVRSSRPEPRRLRSLRPG